MIENIKLIIFDFDGTLADTNSHILNCIRKCIDRFQLKKLSDKELAFFSGATLNTTLQELGATAEQLPKIKDYYTKVFFEDVSDIHLYSNVIPVLKELKEHGYVLAIATNRRKQMIIPLLERLDLLSYFDKVVCETDVENKKPSADMVELILGELHFMKEDTLVLGDTKYDIMMAQNAHCKSGYVCHSKETDNSVMALHPDMVIYNFQELKEHMN